MSYIIDDNYDIDDRSNRYLKAKIEWDSIPKQFRNEIGFYIKGTYESPNKVNKKNCGAVKYVFPQDNELIYANHNCHKASCFICGMSTAYRDAKRISVRLLMVKGCGWDYIRSLSLNFYNKKSKIYADGFVPGVNENLRGWLKKIRKTAKGHLKDNGMAGFYLIFHATRLVKISDEIEIQIWSPHFHVVGIGMMTNSKLFYNIYGYSYRMFKSIEYNDKKAISEQLVGRVGYYLNHSSFSFNVSGRQSNAYHNYGLLANCNIKILDKKKITDAVVDKDGNQVVAKDLTSFIKSDKPIWLKNELYQIEKRMNIDIKRTGYPRVKDEHDFKNLSRLIFNINLEIDKEWENSELDVIISPYTNSPICLVEVETLYKSKVKGYNSIIVSDYELKKDKVPRKQLLNSMEKSIENVHNRFNELKSERLKKSGLSTLPIS